MFSVLPIDGAIDNDRFRKRFDDWRRVIRNTNRSRGTKDPLIPGSLERGSEAIRSQEGIPLLKLVVDDLLYISKNPGYRLR